MFKSRILAAALIAPALAGCPTPEPAAPQARLVRTATVARSAAGETVSLTGQVRAKDQANLGFRLDGRVVERLVNMGDAVEAGQVVARLDPRNEENAVRSAQANLAAAEALLAQARLTYGRQQALLKDGWTSRAKFDEAEQSFQTVKAQVDSARAQLRLKQDQLSYTVLHADGPGVVSAVGAEPGEVVSAGKMIVQLARQGGRDAVFDAPEQLVRTGPRDPLVEIILSNDQTVKATGRIREVAPQADAATRTYQVKVGIIDPPETMRLGATVTGSIQLAAAAGMAVPASALTKANGRSAVWTVDPQSQTVSLRNVEVLRYGPASVVISQGLKWGDVVVTAGVQALRPGQQVKLLGGAS
jgi:RND family efflux transporter MFP subunit